MLAGRRCPAIIDGRQRPQWPLARYRAPPVQSVSHTERTTLIAADGYRLPAVKTALRNEHPGTDSFGLEGDFRLEKKYH